MKIPIAHHLSCGNCSRPRLAGLAALAGLWLFTSPAASASSIFCFNFDDDPVGQGTSFTDVSNGLAAAFEDVDGLDSSFMILPSVFSNLSGNSLYSLDPSTALRITFSDNISGVSLAFALGNSGLLIVKAFDQNSTLVGQIPAAGVMLDGTTGYEGTLTISPAAGFRSLLVSSTSSAGFAIDNVESVPEPGTLMLLAGGLGLMVMGRIRQSV